MELYERSAWRTLEGGGEEDDDEEEEERTSARRRSPRACTESIWLLEASSTCICCSIWDGELSVVFGRTSSGDGESSEREQNVWSIEARRVR